MGFELDRVLDATEDFLRRNIPSRAAREAQKRRAQRKIEEALRRLRRSAMLLAAMLIGLVAWSLFVGPIGFLTWLMAIPTVFLVAFLSLFWGDARPERPRHAPAALSLEQAASRAEDALIDCYRALPGRALPAADAAIARLHELQPHLGQLDEQGLLAGDARRLICEHLPRLVDSYLGLPAPARAPGSEDSRRFGESLGIVAQELDHLLEQCCRDRHLSFETQARFIESRYKQDRRLGGTPG
ncbi:MAG TPA: hypothetical protein VGX37_12030 [Allosphingosinicella sp.]|jgi:hypothetical protein|nr:hypothetical protein [Allosphingosinicella sp.]